MTTDTSERIAFTHRVGHHCDACAEIRKICPHLRRNSLGSLIADSVVVEADVAGAVEELAPKREQRNAARRAHRAQVRLKGVVSPQERLLRAILAA